MTRPTAIGGDRTGASGREAARATWQVRSTQDRLSGVARGASSDPSRPQEPENRARSDQSRPKLVDLGRKWTDLLEKVAIFADFTSILVPKSVSKRVRRKASRRLLFDGVFDDGFVDSSRFSVEFAFSLASRNVWFYQGKTMIFATSLG